MAYSPIVYMHYISISTDLFFLAFN